MIWQQNLDTVSTEASPLNRDLIDLEQLAFEEIFASPICPNVITDIQFDKLIEHGAFRICLGAKGGVVQAYNISPPEEQASGGYHLRELKLDTIFSVKSPVDRPRSVGFIEDNSAQIKVRVLGTSGNW